MRLLRLCLTSTLLFLLGFGVLTEPADAYTTPFRSAGTIYSDNFVSYVNLDNCAETDGLTCDRAFAPSYGNLYFQNFGSMDDFGIPMNAEITHVRTRITGKTTTSPYVGLYSGSTQCTKTESWTLFPLKGSIITSYTYVHQVMDILIGDSVKSQCTEPSRISSLLYRINYSSGSSWSANIDNLEVAFDYVIPEPPPAPEKTPVILIPGIGGSELQVTADTVWSEPDGHGGVYNHLYSAGEKVWVNEPEAIKPGNDDYFDILRMNPDGTSQAQVGITGEIYSGAYQEAINFFIENGYELNKTLFLFPYDWRLDIRLTTPLLHQKILSIKQHTGAEKVNIVAHSMGGLVARNYISNEERAVHVEKLFTLGTPHLGAVDSFKALTYGTCMKYQVGPVCFTLNPDEMIDVTHNMVSAHQLTPSEEYFNFYSDLDSFHPYPFADERDMDGNGVTGSLNYAETKELLTNLGHNTSLYQQSEALHELDVNLPVTNGVRVINIVGSGKPTLGQIVEKNVIDFLGIIIPKRDEIVINGDGTVPLFSASLTDTANDKTLLGDAELYYTRQDHGELMIAGPALQLVHRILSDSTILPEGISATPYSFRGTRLSVHSPVDIHVYDSSGNHTGPTDDGYEVEIPGSRYDTLGDAKFIYLPENDRYEVIFEATGEGWFDFNVRSFEENLNIKTTLFKDVPLTVHTKGIIELDTASHALSPLQLDSDGDGIQESIYPPTIEVLGENNYDHKPPESSVNITGREGENGWYTGDAIVALTAVDEVAGVDYIEYSLDNGQTIQKYSDPLHIEGEGVVKLQFRAVDLAGNEENLQERIIKIDKTPPEAKIYIDLNTRGLLVEWIDTHDTQVSSMIRGTNKKDEELQYLISDEAGNSLLLNIREWDTIRKDRFSIYSLTYNSEAPIYSEKNRYEVSYGTDEKELYLQKQKFELPGNVKITIDYNKKKNQSSVMTQERRTRSTRQVLKGRIFLKLVTNSGKVEYLY